MSMNTSFTCILGLLRSVLACSEAGFGGMTKGVGFGDFLLDMRYIFSYGYVRERGVALKQGRLDCRSPARPGLRW